MRLQLADGVDVLITQEGMKYPPRYSVSGLYVTVGPHTDLGSHEQLLSGTFGSTDWLWSGDDEFRFDNETGFLKAVILATSEETSSTNDLFRAWLRLPVVHGSLKAMQSENFDARPMECRWASDDGQWLACGLEQEVKKDAELLRLRVAASLDFVFADGVFSGWILSSPARYLVRNWEPPSASDCSAELSAMLGEFLSILTEPNIEALQEGDVRVHSSMAKLRRNLASMPSDSRRDLLIERIDELTEEWPSA